MIARGGAQSAAAAILGGAAARAAAAPARPIAMGAIRNGASRLIPPIPGVPPARWEAWVNALAINDDSRDGPLGAPRAIGARGHAGLGIFGFRPKRLEDLGIMRAGAWAPPHSEAAWLRAPEAWLRQYEALRAEALLALGEIGQWPDWLAAAAAGISRSGALALMHRLGPHALDPETNQRHCPLSTVALMRRANRLF